MCGTAVQQEPTSLCRWYYTPVAGFDLDVSGLDIIALLWRRRAEGCSRQPASRGPSRLRGSMTILGWNEETDPEQCSAQHRDQKSGRGNGNDNPQKIEKPRTDGQKRLRFHLRPRVSLGVTVCWRILPPCFLHSLQHPIFPASCAHDDTDELSVRGPIHYAHPSRILHGERDIVLDSC